MDDGVSVKAETPWVWVTPLLMTLGLQMAAAYALRVIPTLAPVLSEALAWGEATAGILTSVATVGSIVFLLIGNPLTRRYGPVRASQIGLLITALGAVMLSWPTAIVAILASFLIGFGYGPSPAGTDILHRYTPAGRRNLAFSIKQAGVPLGGFLAGIILPTALVAAGWQAVLATVLVPTLGIVLMTQHYRARVDAGRNPLQSVRLRALLGFNNIRTPLRAVGKSRNLLRLSTAGFWLSIGHGCWTTFLVSFLVSSMDYSLELAGMMFSIMQLAGIFGRIGLGMLADKVNSVAVLRMNVAASALTSVALVATSPGWPPAAVAVLVAIAGVTVSSWNGLQVAEISRRAPLGLVGEATAGATLFAFAGYVIGPAVFSIILALAGGFGTGFAIVALTTLIALPYLRGLDPDRDPGSGH